MSKIVTDDVLKELIAKLKTLINSKASTDDLNAKANEAHTHAIADVTNLQTTLDNKANATHTHDWDDIPNLEVSLSGKATVSYVNDKLALKADISYVDEKIAESTTGGTIDLDGFVTEEELNEALADLPTSEHTHEMDDFEAITTELADADILWEVEGTIVDGTKIPISNIEGLDAYVTKEELFGEGNPLIEFSVEDGHLVITVDDGVDG